MKKIGPRTQHLMTDGPYRLNRNPMLTGTFILSVPQSQRAIKGFPSPAQQW